VTHHLAARRPHSPAICRAASLYYDDMHPERHPKCTEEPGESWFDWNPSHAFEQTTEVQSRSQRKVGSILESVTTFRIYQSMVALLSIVVVDWLPDFTTQAGGRRTARREALKSR
jgi:hypothetical protein